MITAHDFVTAKLYETEESVIEDALRSLLRYRADLRIQLAIHQYVQGDISLAKAAALAGVPWAEMNDILLERGIQPFLGPETVAEAQAEVRTLRDFLARAV